MGIVFNQSYKNIIIIIVAILIGGFNTLFFYPTFLKATNWFSKAQSLTEPRIFEALKLAGLDK